jgi:quercetin dioxygenase-like cupin family protein
VDIITITKKDRLIEKINHQVDRNKEIIVVNNVVPFLIQLAYSNLKAGDIIERHSHETANEIFYIIKGKVVILGRQFEKTISSGDCFIMPVAEEHELKFLEKTELVYFLLENTEKG